MASKVGKKPKHSSEQPVCKPNNSKRKKKTSETFESTEQVNETSTEPAGKRTRKVLNKTERKRLSDHLNSVSNDTLMCAARSKLAEQYLPDSLKQLPEVLFNNIQLLQSILIHHRCRFIELFIECQKGVDSFVRFKLQWHQHCSAFLLGRSYLIALIHLDKGVEASVASLRSQWLEFYESNGLSDLESKKVMIPITSAVYELMLERTERFQRNLNPDSSGASSASTCRSTDGDDVYFRFGVAALCDMLHQHYKVIKSCQDSQRDLLSQEITILHAINTKVKTMIPQYLRYRDRGFMYFPDVSFIPFLRSIDEVVRKVVNTDTLQDEGIIQVFYLYIYHYTH